jgi:predicted phosphoadenosine phosphosulfate sulfurtransferase
MCHNFSQVRGEVMHEFSLLEYNVRSYLAEFLASQPKRILDTYRKQFERFVQFFARQPIEWNPKVLGNPDVQRMDAELMASEQAFANCIDQLLSAAQKAGCSKIELTPLVAELKAATRQRNILTHSVWLEIEGKAVMQNFPDYHRRKRMLIKGDGERVAPQRSPEWTLQELQTFAAHLHDLSDRLTNLFKN